MDPRFVPMKSTSIRRAAALPHCRYCGRPGTATRHLGRRRRRAMFICERCTWASTLLYNRDGTRTMVFLEEQYNQQIADVGVACFRKHIFLLHSRWSRYCDFCERVGRDAGQAHQKNPTKSCRWQRRPLRTPITYLMQSPFRACFQGKCSCARPGSRCRIGSCWE
jgi:hypothetical protein